MKLALAVALVACGGAPSTPLAPTLEHHAPAGPPPVVTWDALVGPIRTIEIASPDPALVPQARQLVAGEVGQPIDRARLRGELRGVLALSGVSDVSARGIQAADGVTLVVEVVPQPVVHAITAHERGGGNIALTGQLAVITGSPLAPVLLDTIADQFRDHYLESGFVDVTTGWTSKPAGRGQVDIVVEIVPGKAVTVTGLELHGNVHVKRDELVKALANQPEIGKPWVRDVVERSTLVLTAYYFDHGYVNVAIEAPLPTGEQVPVVYEIHEGDQFRLGKLSVTGVPADQAKTLAALLPQKKGDVFSRSALQAGIAKMQDAAHVTVTPLTSVDPMKKTIDVTFEVAK